MFETVMVNDADGGEYTMRAVYDVVDRPALLAWTEEGSGMSVTIRFTDLGDGRTEVVTRQDHDVAWDMLAPALRPFLRPAVP